MINNNTSIFNYNGYITTFSKREVKLDAPTPDMICIQDIVTGLVHQNHWVGQTLHPLTVAQHTMMVVALVPEELKAIALLHDAAEAYTGDINKPLKVLLGEPMAKIEEGLNKVIFEKFGYNSIESIKLIKPYDKQVQKIEWEGMFEHKETLNEFMSEHFHTQGVWSREYSKLKLIDAFRHFFTEQFKTQWV